MKLLEQQIIKTEEHIPECTPLYGVSICSGSTVAKKAGRIDTIIEADNRHALRSGGSGSSRFPK